MSTGQGEMPVGQGPATRATGSGQVSRRELLRRAAVDVAAVTVGAASLWRAHSGTAQARDMERAVLGTRDRVDARYGVGQWNNAALQAIRESSLGPR
jgi:hypothetical protein